MFGFSLFIISEIIHRVIQVLILVILAQVLLSYFMSPFDRVRQTLDRFVNRMLNPIRRVLPPIGGFDFSPVALIILLQVLDMVQRSILLSF